MAGSISSSTTTSSDSRSSSSCWETAIDSSNIGFQLLKKHGWKEGTGLGISEQVCFFSLYLHLAASLFHLIHRLLPLSYLSTSIAFHYKFFYIY
uniref:G-patch domain-containing protein n=1 Tax=Rhizophora mucronata TaxID=61149 RepID=A0A2P2IJR9_RHIMU